MRSQHSNLLLLFLLQAVALLELVLALQPDCAQLHRGLKGDAQQPPHQQLPAQRLGGGGVLELTCDTDVVALISDYATNMIIQANPKILTNDL